MELALRIGLRSAAYQAAALPLSYASVEALTGFEPMTRSFGGRCAGPLRYRANCRYQVSGARCQKKRFPALVTPDT